MDVYVVTVETGEYSEYECHLDGVYADEARAVEHIVRDYHGELNDRFSMGGLAWETDVDEGRRLWGDYYDLDEDRFVERADDAPYWWENWLMEPIVHRIRRMHVVGT